MKWGGGGGSHQTSGRSPPSLHLASGPEGRQAPSPEEAVPGTVAGAPASEPWVGCPRVPGEAAAGRQARGEVRSQLSA